MKPDSLGYVRAFVRTLTFSSRCLSLSCDEGDGFESDRIVSWQAAPPIERVDGTDSTFVPPVPLV